MCEPTRGSHSNAFPADARPRVAASRTGAARACGAMLGVPERRHTDAKDQSPRTYSHQHRCCCLGRLDDTSACSMTPRDARAHQGRRVLRSLPHDKMCDRCVERPCFAQEHLQEHEQGFGATTFCMLDDARRCTTRTPLHSSTATLPLHYRNSTRLDVHSTTHRCVEWPCLTEAKSVPLTRDCSEDVDKRRFEEDRRVRERGRERTCKSRCRDAKAYRNHR